MLVDLLAPLPAGNVVDDISPRVQGAASSTKDKVNDVLPHQVKNAAGSAGERINIAGNKSSSGLLWVPYMRF